MIRILQLLTASLALWALACGAVYAQKIYPWHKRTPGQDTLSGRFPPPPGFVPVKVKPGGFEEWLLGLPMKPANSPVYLHNGALKLNQSAHAGVIDIDVGRGDLQQCADAIMRLRAEYLYSRGRLGAIAFNYTSGDKVAFSRWARGWRPVVRGNKVTWRRRGKSRDDYTSFRHYMRAIFAYAGTYSLAREMQAIGIENLGIGDVFIKGGFPGHAVMVGNVVVHRRTGEKRFLLIQSFMPAQDMHVLVNPRAGGKTVWYSEHFGDKLVTPEWVFARTSLKRFR